jgi:hypothetical protein
MSHCLLCLELVPRFSGDDIQLCLLHADERILGVRHPRPFVLERDGGDGGRNDVLAF